MHLPRTEILLRAVAAHEEEIFGRHRKREESRLRSERARQMAKGGEVDASAFGGLYPPKDATQKQLHDAIKAFAEAPEGEAQPQSITLPAQLSGFHRASAHLYVTILGCAESSNPDKSITVRRKGPDKPAPPPATAAAAGGDEDLDFETRLKLRMDAKELELQKQVDTVRYGERDWKARYYSSKLGLDGADEAGRALVTGHYVRGLCWVLMYYYQGVQDWEWYYPFHYAPCASELVDLAEFAGGQFEIGAPFTPLEQLMSVFPPASGHAMPAAYRQLMVAPQSPIIDFYPIDFRNDLNGKKFSWQALALLPFIDAARLRAALRPLRATLTPSEQARGPSASSPLLLSSPPTPPPPRPSRAGRGSA